MVQRSLCDLLVSGTGCRDLYIVCKVLRTRFLPGSTTCDSLYSVRSAHLSTLRGVRHPAALLGAVIVAVVRFTALDANVVVPDRVGAQPVVSDAPTSLAQRFVLAVRLIGIEVDNVIA